MRDAQGHPPAARGSEGAGVETSTDLRLLLLVTGDAPRSQRARSNLRRALAAAELDAQAVEEIDLLERPDAALALRVFATPALLWVRGDEADTALYGDLSDRAALMAFLAGTVGPPPR